MKRFGFLLAMLALVLAFGLVLVSCDDGTTTSSGSGGGGGGSGGVLTITDIPQEHFGKYTTISLSVRVDGSWVSVYGGDFVTTTVGNTISTRQYAIQIKSSTVVIPLWYEYVDYTTYSVKTARFTGSGSTETNSTLLGLWEDRACTAYLDAPFWNIPITFTNGNGTVSYSTIR